MTYLLDVTEYIKLIRGPVINPYDTKADFENVDQSGFIILNAMFDFYEMLKIYED